MSLESKVAELQESLLDETYSFEDKLGRMRADASQAGTLTTVEPETRVRQSTVAVVNVVGLFYRDSDMLCMNM